MFKNQSTCGRKGGRERGNEERKEGRGRRKEGRKTIVTCSWNLASKRRATVTIRGEMWIEEPGATLGCIWAMQSNDSSVILKSYWFLVTHSCFHAIHRFKVGEGGKNVSSFYNRIHLCYTHLTLIWPMVCWHHMAELFSLTNRIFHLSPKWRGEIDLLKVFEVKCAWYNPIKAPLKRSYVLTQGCCCRMW